MITLKRFNGALVTPKDDAVLFDHLVDDSGILEGISVSHLGANQLLVSAGRGIIKGRDFTVEEEIILAQISPSGVQKGRLLVRVDISNMESPISLVTQVATTLPALVQEDINRDGTIYEMPIATYDVSELLISNMVFVGKMLQPLKGVVDGHVGSAAVHVTASDKTNWNSKAAGSHKHDGVYEPANGNIVKTNVTATMTAPLIANGASAIGTAQMRNIYAGTGDIGVGAALATGSIYIVYEG